MRAAFTLVLKPDLRAKFYSSEYSVSRLSPKCCCWCCDFDRIVPGSQIWIDVLFKLPVCTIGRSVLELGSVQLKDERSAWLDHLAITIVILFGKWDFESENSVFLRHGCVVSVKRYKNEDPRITYS
jgi:hypothetical protein